MKAILADTAWPGEQLPGRVIGAAIGWNLSLAMLTFQLAASHQWLAAAACFALLVAPFVFGWLFLRRNRQAAIEEARRARNPLNLS